MENKDDWKELEEWNTLQKEENIFYENRDIKPKAKKISKIANILSIITTTPIIIIFFILLIIILIFLNSFFHSLKVDTETDILEQLKNQYSQDFVIINEKNIGKNEIEYKISPKNDKTIVFKAIQKNFVQHNDYEEYLIKQILKDYINTFPETNIKYIDSTNISNDYEFYKLKYGIEITNFSEITKAVKEIYECNDFIYKKLNKLIKDKNFYFYAYLKLNNWNIEIQNNIYNNDLNLYVYNAQYSYIDYLKNNGIKDNDITEADINNIWKPKELDIYLDSKNIGETATYNLELKEYEINFNIILNNMDEVEKIYDKYGKLDGFIYNEREYKLHYDNNKLEKNNVPYQCRISYLEQILKCNIEYNYNNKQIYISK